MALYTNLGKTSDSFKEMMKRFGVVTVMNAKVFEVPENLDKKTAYQIYQDYGVGTSNTPLCTLDTLKIM